jgi:hypothetical protein
LEGLLEIIAEELCRDAEWQPKTVVRVMPRANVDDEDFNGFLMMRDLKHDYDDEKDTTIFSNPRWINIDLVMYLRNKCLFLPRDRDCFFRMREYGLRWQKKYNVNDRQFNSYFSPSVTYAMRLGAAERFSREIAGHYDMYEASQYFKSDSISFGYDAKDLMQVALGRLRIRDFFSGLKYRKAVWSVKDKTKVIH